MNDAEISAHGRFVIITWGNGGTEILEVQKTFPYPESLAEMVVYLLKDKADLLLAAANVDLKGRLL